MPLQTYSSLISRYENLSDKLRKRLQWMSALRLSLFILFIVTLIYYFRTDHAALLLVAMLSLISFLVFIRKYDAEKRKLDLAKALLSINQIESEIMGGGNYYYEDGKEFIDQHHPFSYDLDIFGEGSLYQYINRCTTSFGKEHLSRALLNPDTSVIKERQDAVKELGEQIDFRQQLQASGMIHSGEEKKISSLKKWLSSKPAFKSRTFYYLLWIFPTAVIVCAIMYLLTDQSIYSSLMGLLLVINLAISFSFAKKMTNYISVSTDINKTLQQFAEQIALIEKSDWRSTYLKNIQARFGTHRSNASQLIAKLASLFNYLDYLFNVFVSPLLNSFVLFHVHILYQLDKWREDHGKQVMNWLELIGETEALNSLANLHFNNPDFTFPELSESEDLSAESMGHPLIKAKKRVNNSISFRNNRFVILTGSNMSGKSTFLRTLGINLILARAGSVVCADRFVFYPYDVFVSMRITDSLQDSESFFYAELKRLHNIIGHLREGNKTFIILDEILRGTNSNDKHNGTVGLIRQLVAGNATGIIATHDLTVGDLTASYPDYLANKCFESSIINDELIFDYKIKEGVCTRLSASFLMKKMGIIEY